MIGLVSVIMKYVLTIFVRFGQPQTVDPIIESLIEKASFRLWLAYY